MAISAVLRRPSPQGAGASTPWIWGLGGALLGLMAAVLLFAPARWLADGLGQASGGQVLLLDPRGTVWTGSAQLVLSGGAGSLGQVALPGRMSWQLRPAWGGLAGRLNAPCCMAQAMNARLLARWGGAQLAVADHRSNWPAGLLAGLGTPWNTVQAQGLLDISTQGLSLEWLEGRIALGGRLQVDAQELASRLSTVKPMGSYRLTINGGTVNTMQLETLSGSLQLNGSGQWVGGRLRFNGIASSTPERLEALSNLLNIIGRRDGARAIITVG